MKLEDLTAKVAQYDETLARDIKDYLHGRKYGLVFEASKPEYVRMWNKPVVRGDAVNILPPRGVLEDGNHETESNDIYIVIECGSKTSSLKKIGTDSIIKEKTENLVAVARFDRPIYAGLKELDRVERAPGKPYHSVISGENYHVLQMLAYAFPGKVDCIYIDPPYNSGAKDWKYNNNYVGADDAYRHSKWLTFMEDRLKLAKKLLNPDDSVMIVTIDEKEYLRLGLLLEQLFPEAKIQMVSDVINPRGATRDGQFSRSDEYIYIVQLGNNSVVYPKKAEKHYVEWYRLRRTDYDSRRGTVKGGTQQFYPIYVDVKTEKIVHIGDPLSPDEDRNSVPKIKGAIPVFPIKNDGTEMNWGVTPDTLRLLLNNHFVRVRKNSEEKNQPYLLHYISYKMLEAIEEGRASIEGYNEDGTAIVVEEEGHVIRPGTAWNIPSHNAGTYGSEILADVIGEKRFPFPKSVYSTLDDLRYFLKDKKDALVVDFFSGSGTTLHAVNLLNAEDGGIRRCIAVTNNEVSAAEAKQFTEKKLRQGDPEWEKFGIAKYVTWPRTKCSITGKNVRGQAIKGTYGCEIESYKECDLDAIDPETGKKVRKKLYYKTKEAAYPELDKLKIEDGFAANAIFFDIEYLEPNLVGADMAYNKVAPILWMCGGCYGDILQRSIGYSIGKTYAILFDVKSTKKFVNAVQNNRDIKTVFIVTDSAERYRSLCENLPDRRVLQLYESYLRSFEINAIG